MVIMIFLYKTRKSFKNKTQIENKIRVKEDIAHHLSRKWKHIRTCIFRLNNFEKIGFFF